MTTEPQPMHDQALARSRLYALLQQLFLQGITAQTASTVLALPDLAEALPVSGVAPRLDLDQAAASHQALFGFNIFPYESIFLTSASLLGSDYSEAVVTNYQAVGYQPSAQAGAADHLGEELGLLSFLCAAEADAWADGRVGIVRRLQGEQRRFLETHLLRWLMPCVIGIQRHDEHFFAYLATITGALVGSHYATCLNPRANHPQQFNGGQIGDEGRQPDWALPAPPMLLNNPKTALKDIANLLTTPVYSGIFLSRHLINQLGRAHRLPRGFGGREQLLTNLLRTAAQYETLPALLTTMMAELNEWQQAYRQQLAAQPDLTGFIQPWHDRIDETKALLTAIDIMLVATGVDFDGDEPMTDNAGNSSRQ